MFSWSIADSLTDQGVLQITNHWSEEFTQENPPIYPQNSRVNQISIFKVNGGTDKFSYIDTFLPKMPY